MSTGLSRRGVSGRVSPEEASISSGGPSEAQSPPQGRGQGPAPQGARGAGGGGGVHPLSGPGGLSFAIGLQHSWFLGFRTRARPYSTVPGVSGLGLRLNCSGSSPRSQPAEADGGPLGLHDCVSRFLGPTSLIYIPETWGISLQIHLSGFKSPHHPKPRAVAGGLMDLCTGTPPCQ